MLWLEDRCATVVTDSGGVQKEAYFHGKRCVTVRDETEWVELVALGVNAIVGVDRARIATAIDEAMRPIDGDRTVYGKRSEEHTSELQSLMRISYAVFCLKKKTRNISYAYKLK